MEGPSHCLWESGFLHKEFILAILVPSSSFLRGLQNLSLPHPFSSRVSSADPLASGTAARTVNDQKGLENLCCGATF